MQVILYQNDKNGVSVLIPAPEVLKTHSIFDVAVKDVPPNIPFRIADTNELPDFSTIDSWTIDIKDLNHGIGGVSNEFN